jgi:hypothetical protein
MKWDVFDPASIELSMPKTGSFVTSKSNTVFATLLKFSIAFRVAGGQPV